MPKLNNKGIVPITFMVGLLVLGLFGYFGYSYFSNSKVQENAQEEDVLALLNPRTFKFSPCSKNEPVSRQFLSPDFKNKQGWSTQNGQPCFYNRVEQRNNRQALRDLVGIRKSYLTGPTTEPSKTTTPNDVIVKPRAVSNVKTSPSEKMPAKFSVGDNDLFTKFLYDVFPPQNRNIFIGYAAPEPRAGSRVKSSILKGCLDFFPDTTVGQKIKYETFANPLTGLKSTYVVFNNVETYLPGKDVFESRVIWQVSGPMINVSGGTRYCENVIVVPNTVKELTFFTNMKGYIAPTSPARTPNTSGGSNSGGGSSTGGGSNSGGGSSTGGGSNSGGGSSTGGGSNSGGGSSTGGGTPAQPPKFVGCSKSTTSGTYFSNCYAGRVQNSTNCDVMSYQMNTARCTFAAEVGEYCSSIMGGCNTRYNIKVVSRRSTSNPF